MIGALISLIMYIVDYVNYAPIEKALLDASSWLYNWSLFWAIATAFALFVGMFINVTNRGAATKASCTVGGHLIAVLVGAGLRTFGFVYVVVCAINTALLVGGAYLVRDSAASSVLDQRRLVVGLAMIGFTFLVRAISFWKLRRVF